MSFPGRREALITVECSPRCIENEPFAVLLERAGADFTGLRGLRRGVVRCPFHQDKHPSLSVDLARGLFHCFGCGVGGGIARLRALLGKDRPRRRETPAQQRLREHAGRRRALEARWGEVVPLWRASDGVRHRRRLVASLRTLATRWGAEHPASWPVLVAAARLESEAAAREAALDTALASERGAA